MSRYDPVCVTCRLRPKMDRCDCCEECWYSGRFSEHEAWKRMTPRQRRLAAALDERDPMLFAGNLIRRR